MSGYQQRTCRYPNLRITVKHETDERSVKEIYSKPRAYRSNHSTTIYYNSNYPSTIQRRSQKNDRFYQQQQQQQQPIRPLMEIPNNQFFIYPDRSYSNAFKQRQQPKQRSQYRNRKAELDWDHAFDLDQIDLYTQQNDIDNHSLISSNSSSDNSFSCV